MKLREEFEIGREREIERKGEGFFVEDKRGDIVNYFSIVDRCNRLVEK